MKNNITNKTNSVIITGLLEIKVEKTYENSTVSQILNLVQKKSFQ